MAANVFLLHTVSRLRSFFATSLPFTNQNQNQNQNPCTSVPPASKSQSKSKCQSTCFPLFISHAVTVNGAHSAPMFADSGIMLFLLFQEMGFNDKDARVILDTNAALTYLPSDHIRSRIQLLQSVGLKGLALSRVALKRPDVLTAPEIDAILSVIVDGDDLDLKGKIEPAQIERLLTGTDPRFLVGFETKLRLLLQFGIPKEKLGKVLNTVNLAKALCFKSSEEMERLLAFLHPFGGADLVLRWPAILNYDLDSQLMPRIGYLLELSGQDHHATATVLRKFPSALAYSLDHLKDHVEFLKSYAGLSYEEIFRVILVYPSLFSASRKRKLHPRIDFLKQCKLSSGDIYRFLIRAPLFLSLSFEENLANKLVFLVKIGYKNRTKELAMAMGAVTRCSCKNFQAVVGVLLSYGLSCRDILEMSKKHPQVLQYNHKSLEDKLEYLTQEMGREVGELLSFPAFLGYKLDGRIKHRYEERRKVLGEGMSINKLLSVSTASFASTSRKKPISEADENEEEMSQN
ncbi:transcription termination factor MTERF8, chloroplastic [Andrographis paniculata]|uniref:transcription termination factor MTERF8, chloroplastic n=1 Tax=Andrographis paniculata TaxID=175694 RepID=UPI0021E8242A|nr:transcription termination factor MTERF8, chloroplastic [Andrographis paniculata]